MEDDHGTIGIQSDKLKRQLDGVAHDTTAIEIMLDRASDADGLEGDVAAIQEGLQYSSNAASIRTYDAHAGYLLDHGLSPDAAVNHCVQYMHEEHEGRYFAEDSQRGPKPLDRFTAEQEQLAGMERVTHPDLLDAAYDRFLNQYAD